MNKKIEEVVNKKLKKSGINGTIISNLVTNILLVKNLPVHYKFCKLNRYRKMLNKKRIETAYQSLIELINNNPDLREKVAIISDRQITYGQMLDEIEKVSKYLHFVVDAFKGENVSICANGNIEGIIAFFALNKLGLVNARIFNGSRDYKFRENLINFGSRTVFTDNKNLDVLSNIAKDTKVKNVILMEECDEDKVLKFVSENPTINIITWNKVLEIASTIKEDYIENVNEFDLASILYTSGSSGEPKPISISNKVYVNMVDMVTSTTGIKKCDVEKAVGVVSHEYPYSAINSTVMVLLMGKTLIIPNNHTKEEDYFNDLLQYQPEKIQAIPNFYKLLEAAQVNGNLKIKDLKFLKNIVSGGETFLSQEKVETLKFMKKMNSTPLLIDGFGFGEMGSATALKFGLNEYFLLMNGIEAKAVDPETLEDLPLDREGILCLTGPSIAENYYNNEEATKKSFIYDKNGKKWFLSDTYGSVHGKFRRLIKLGGRIREYFITSDLNGNFVKVYAGNVENVIMTTECIEDCVVVPSDSKGTPKPVAYISLREDCKLSKEEIISQVILKCNSLEKFAQPSQIYIEDEIKRTSAKKKDYKFYKEKHMNC